MLIQPDRLRKLLIVVFSVLFLVLAIQVRFDMLFVHVLDNGGTLVIQNLLLHALAIWVALGGLFAHYWVIVLLSIGLALFFKAINYQIAMWWFLITQFAVLLLTGVLSLILQVYWSNGLKIGPMMPDLLLVWWLQFLAVIVAIILPRVCQHQRTRVIITTVTVVFWLLILLARMKFADMPLSSGMGALFFGYFWWQLSEQQYRKRAQHWRSVLKIDTQI